MPWENQTLVNINGQKLLFFRKPNAFLILEYRIILKNDLMNCKAEFADPL